MKEKKFDDIYSLSPMQEGMLFHSLLSDSDAYFEQMAFKFKGSLDLPVFEKCFNLLIERHAIFRSVFLHEGVSKPKQVVLKERSIKIAYQNLSSKPAEEQFSIIEYYKSQDKKKGFNLSKDLLMRFAVFQTSREDYTFIWSFHHILMDGWSLGIVLNELFDLYGKIRNGEEPKLEKPAEFSKYISWLQKQDQKEARVYWDNYLKDYNQIANLPSRSTSEALLGYERKEIVFRLGTDITKKLNDLARQCKVTLNVVIQAIWGILLQRYNNTTDAVFGSIVSGRPSEIPSVEKIVGLFINAVPVRVKKIAGQSFLQLVKQLQEEALRSEPFSYVSLADIQSGKETGNQLVNHMVVFENYPFDDSIQSREGMDKYGFTLTEVDAFDQTNYDFNLLIGPGQDLIIKIIFNERRYTQDTIHAIFSHLKMMVNTVVHSPDVQVDEIDMLSVEDKTRILEKFNSTGGTYPKTKTLSALFEEQVLMMPSRTALVFGDQEVSYSKLNRMANQVARSLRRQGVQRNQIVGILTERSLEMIVSILGILKAGAAYLPIDPNYPEERIRYMLEDSGAEKLIVQYAEDVPTYYSGQVLGLWEREWEKEDSANLEAEAGPDDLAYIIYTSGSTGQPKGVMVEHRNVVRLLFNDQNLFDFSEEDVWTLFHSYCFDFSVWEMYGALLYGGRLVLVPSFVARDPEAFAELLLKEKVTILNQTPTAFYQLSHQMKKVRAAEMPVRKVIFGGEKLSPLQLKDWKAAYPSTQLINMYGITETTVHVTYKEITEKEIETNISNIGKPIPTLQVYVLDGQKNLLPVGIGGEMYVAGEGVARGYLNRPELTEERFVENPFQPGERMYKTGDLARWLEDGNLEYLGRMDDQVKIRGHRIELGEIEARLLAVPYIKEACVIARNDNQGQSYLCAYMVTNEVRSQNSIRTYLKGMLPEYMIPAYYVFLDRFPLTFNGKIDKAGLPEPQKERVGKYEEPINDTERELAEIWSKVLDIKQLGRRDHFFELGGHSLKATQLAAAIHKKFETRIPIQKIFENPILMDMAQYIRDSDKENFHVIKRAPKREYYPVSAAQRRMYVVQQIEGGTQSTHYNMPLILELEGTLDIDRLHQSLSSLVDRHEPLRTTFHLKNDRLIQRIESHCNFEFELKEITEERLPQIIDEFIRPFDLETGLPFRALLVKVESTRYFFMLDFHHIVSDGISVNILIQEFIQLYQGKELPSLRIQYKDFAEWQQTAEYKNRIKAGEEYWLDCFKSDPPVLELPTDFPRPPVQSFFGETLEFELDSKLYQKLKSISAAEGSTLYMILLSAYTILLSKYTGQEDIVVGSPVAGREHSDLEDVVGMFINTLPLRNEPKGVLSVREFIANVRSGILKAFEHADYPLEELIEKLNIPRNLSRQPLFNTMMVMQNMKIDEIHIPGLNVAPYSWRRRNAKYDLTWTIIEDSSLKVMIEYSTSIFRKETVEKMYLHFSYLLSQITDDLDKLIFNIQLATPYESSQILKEFNPPEAEYPREKTIHEIFMDKVKKVPDKVALQYKEGSVSYSELHRKSNQVARFLQKQGVGREQIVGLLVDRSPEMIISILGILKAGAAYLPIDPDYPEERIRYMLEDSGAEKLIVQYAEDVPAHYSGQVLELWKREWEKENSADLGAEAGPDDLAYIIYTSGSTGQPKGVMVEHRNVIRLLFNDQNLFDFSEEDVWTLFHSYCFDFSVWEMYGALLYGGRLVLVPSFVARDPEAFAELLLKEKVTILNQTPTAFYQLSHQMKKVRAAEMPVRKVIFGGEKLSPLQLKDWKAAYPSTQLINMYGITETTVHVTYKEITEKEIETNISNIGKPIPTLQVYVLDGQKNLLPVGIGGEMYVAGEGVARGYLNRPELTEERFVENPFQPGERMYKTGDLARWLEDGNLEYLGRMDDQVKIRGHRIELGEIESRLLTYSAVKEAVVISVIDEQDYSYLCAYIVSLGKVTVSSIRNYLREVLPDYMIPSYFVEVESFPLTPNGKIDKKALPEPTSAAPLREEYSAPLSDREKLLATVWEEVLRTERVGIHDNFFELGGDSIKAIQIAARLNEHGLKFEMKDLFKNPTVYELVPYIRFAAASAEQGLIQGDVPLTPIQRWFFEQQFPIPEHFNQSMMLFREEEWNSEAVIEAFHKLCVHHDALRMVYPSSKQYSRGTEAIDFTLQRFDFRGVTDAKPLIEKEANYLQAGLNLEEGPLIKLGIFETDVGSYLLIIIHHLVVDGVSWRILLEDFYRLYEKGEVLPPKSTSYRAWASGLSEYARSRAIQKEIPYWEGVESMKVAPLPKDRENDGSFSKIEALHFSLDEKETHQLLTEAHRAYQTEINDLLLAALALTVQEWTGENRMAVSLEGHGREDFIKGADLSRTIGWFTSMFPVVFDVPSSDLGSVIKGVKETLRKVPRKGAGYGVLRYLVPAEENKIKYKIKPEIIFNYLGQFEINSKAKYPVMPMGEPVSLENKHGTGIELTAIVTDGKLKLNLMFNSIQYNVGTVENILDQYKSHLLHIINHCVAKEKSEPTPSDFSMSQLTQSDLDDVFEALKSVK